jgi:hypothetical protein
VNACATVEERRFSAASSFEMTWAFSPCGANLPAVLLQIGFVFVRVVEKREAQAEILSVEL